jgi:hypothetical protein
MIERGIRRTPTKPAQRQTLQLAGAGSRRCADYFGLFEFHSRTSPIKLSDRRNNLSDRHVLMPRACYRSLVRSL